MQTIVQVTLFRVTSKFQVIGSKSQVESQVFLLWACQVRVESQVMSTFSRVKSKSSHKVMSTLSSQVKSSHKRLSSQVKSSQKFVKSIRVKSGCCVTGYFKSLTIVPQPTHKALELYLEERSQIFSKSMSKKWIINGRRK